ncbi:MAG: hypothetical protein WBA93_13335 [Microcoleaceae cyanobacterium]
MKNKLNLSLYTGNFIAMAITMIEMVGIPLNNLDNYFSESEEGISQQMIYQADERPPVPDKNGTSY